MSFFLWLFFQGLGQPKDDLSLHLLVFWQKYKICSSILGWDDFEWLSWMGAHFWPIMAYYNLGPMCQWFELRVLHMATFGFWVITVTSYDPRGISNHRQFDYSFNSLFTTKQHQSSALLNICDANQQMNGEYPWQNMSYAKSVTCHDIIMRNANYKKQRNALLLYWRTFEFLQHWNITLVPNVVIKQTDWGGACNTWPDYHRCTCQPCDWNSYQSIKSCAINFQCQVLTSDATLDKNICCCFHCCIVYCLWDFVDRLGTVSI